MSKLIILLLLSITSVIISGCIDVAEPAPTNVSFESGTIINGDHIQIRFPTKPAGSGVWTEDVYRFHDESKKVTCYLTVGGQVSASGISCLPDYMIEK